MTSHFDYIIAGGGCAGLSLVMHMIRSGAFSDKQILIVDKDPKQSNDRTWCFWDEHADVFSPVVYRSWNQIWFRSDDYSSRFTITPYRYHMVRGIDFYNFCKAEISLHSNITWLQKKVDRVFSNENGTGIVTEGETISANFVFCSILFEQPKLAANEYGLLQHFKGWVIEVPEDSFDTEAATLMDFRTDQRFGTAFCYLLPFTKTRALIEYTVFSGNLLEEDEYKEGVRTYIQEILGIKKYHILEEEFGVIPMTNHKFPQRQNHIIYLGTAGGQTKGSSGYTFNFIQKHSAKLVDALKKTGNPFVPAFPKRFSFYDSVLLHILDHNSLSGKEIFNHLFRKNDPRKVLKFLDNESSPAEELKLISTLPVLPFLGAAIRHMLNRK